MMQPFETLTKRGQISRLKKLALNTLSAYDIQAQTLKPLRHGDNTTFRIDTTNGKRYVLRVHRTRQRTPDEIRSEMMWLVFLNQQGFAVPSPVFTKDNKLITVSEAKGIPEPRTCILFHWLNGHFIDDKLSPKHLALVGEFTARLHSKGNTFSPPEVFVRGRLDNLCGKPRGVSEAFARSQISNPEDEARAIRLVTEICSPEDGERVGRLIGMIRKTQLELGQSAETFGLIHGDLHQENYCFQDDQLRVIDFDDCGYGYYLYDIAVTFFNLDGHENASTLKEGFLKGYRRIRPLPEQHETYLGTFMNLRELQMMLWVIEMRHHPEFRDTWQEDVRASCKYIANVVATEAIE